MISSSTFLAIFIYTFFRYASRVGFNNTILFFTLCIAFSEKNRTNHLLMHITYIFTIIVSSPLHHNWYGGEQWSSGEIDGIAIYNFLTNLKHDHFYNFFYQFSRLN